MQGVNFGNGWGGGGGGDGGHGVALAAGGTLINAGTIVGGNGGTGGLGWKSTGSPVVGTVEPSLAGASGAGGIGVVGSNLNIVNSGTIMGGLSGDGTTRTNAVQFFGGTNSLTLAPGSNIVGNVVAFSTADTLALGGSGTASFNAALIGSQYRGFGQFQKTGDSTWTLTGTPSGTAVTSWQLLGGTLSVASNANLGAAAGTLTFDGGTLQVTGISFTNLSHRAGQLELVGEQFIDCAACKRIGSRSGPGMSCTKNSACSIMMSFQNRLSARE